MTQPPCRWGILGAANIARKNWKAIHRAGSALIAVASRDRAKAQQFIDACQADVPFKPAPAACGSYEELLARKDVDAVYIPLPTGIRKEWVVRAAEAGKHVLCEKPCGKDAGEVRAMLDACAENKLQFMDGVMFMHSKRLPLLRNALDDGQSVGELRRIDSQFSFLASEEFLTGNIRVNHDLEPLGCLGDLGWYNIRFSLWVMNFATPERVSGRLLHQHGRADSRHPVPTEFSGELFFPGGVSASFYCSFRTQLTQWASISGTKGYIDVPDFVLPFYGNESAFTAHQVIFRVRNCEYNVEHYHRRCAAAEYSSGAPDAQESNMIRTFGEIVASGKLEPQWGEIALQTQRVVDGCLQSARDGGRLVAV